ncbi:U3 small nucleolar RNA-associated protein 4 homolog [Chelonus insularis]|uniref:U3 small nucleolar RNA-associated protein 4 homolog n=1 Tax=Chelonus insularis TaxID=460826 RepID=UPI00158E9F6C|nr:U3 small nucleolar RNA-associated protein 4 homolog [Chelonus insularis]
MSCKIHNVRFYNLEPRSISCLTYEKRSKKLALSRSDNSIEIWDVKDFPFLESTIAGDPGDSIESMVWINHLRLLSTGLNGTVKEYDLIRLRKKNETSVTGGAAWCIDINPHKNRVAVGTEDGYINTFSVTSDSLIYERIFDKQKGRILCLKWDNTGNMIFTGSPDTIRVWNAETGHAVHKMTTSRKHIKKETIVWSLGVTDNNFIVSGDSRGVLSIWDPVVGILIESHESHIADILALSVSCDSNTIYCAGVDSIIRCFSRVIKTAGSSIDKSGKVTPRWVKGIERRLHTHDVRSLVEADGKLFSGGVDGYLAQSSYPPKMLTKYPPLLETPSVIVCRESRCILLRYVNYLELWKLGTATNETVSSGMFYPLESEPIKLLELRTKGGESIVSYAVSRDSKIIVYSTESHTRVFNFDLVDGNPQLMRGIENNDLPIHIQKMSFSPNNKLFVAVTNEEDGNKISIFKVIKNKLVFKGVLFATSKTIENIRLLCFSPNEEYLICSDRQGNVIVYVIDEKLISKSPNWWPLPKYSRPPTAMAVQTGTSNLVIVYSDHKVVEYNLLKKQYTKFSNELQNRIPTHWLARQFPITNITFDPANKDVIIVHDDNTVYAIHKNFDSQNVKPIKIRKYNNADDENSSGSSSQGHNIFSIIKKYKHLVHLEWFSTKEMVAVEIHPTSLLEKLPPMLKKKCFGVM